MRDDQEIAVVTGAGRGIGFAIVRALLTSGFTVIGIDIDAAQLGRTERELTDEGAPFRGLVADLTQAEEVARVFRTVEDDYARIDVLVNNAGTCLMHDFLEISPDELRRQMAINFDSAFFCTQAAIKLMLQQDGYKKIINISSNGAYNFDVFDPLHYRTSKASMDTMTKHLARQYARERVCVNSIAPAMTRTDLFDVVSTDVLEKAIAGMPHGEPMEPEQVADWVRFLASDAGNICSGNVIILNQGRDVR